MSLDYKNFDEIVSYAEKYSIKIAFENTEGEEYLFALMEHFKNTDTVGFCWDSGHEMCYNHSQDLLSKYGDRLIMTHINDNLGISRFDGKTFWTDDLHLLPFDGIADWDYNVMRLKKSKHLDILNFELNINSKPERHENDVYEQMTLEQYFTEAYKRACKIAYKYSK
jgi:sugar phosphate isomerase/epimerase